EADVAPAEEKEDEREEAPAARRRRSRRGGRGRARADERPAPAAPPAEDEEEEADAGDREVEGVVELLANGSGFVRVSPPEPSDDDVYVSAAPVRRCELVPGDTLAGPARAGKTEALRRLAGALAEREGLVVSAALAGVRPEEITEWSAGPVPVAASAGLSASVDAQGQAVEHAVEQARRIAARGGDA